MRRRSAASARGHWVARARSLSEFQTSFPDETFETMLGLASHHHPKSYWDIVGRDNPRKGVPTVRREPRRRRTATGMRADRSRPPEKVERSPVSDSTRQT